MDPFAIRDHVRKARQSAEKAGVVFNEDRARKIVYDACMAQFNHYSNEANFGDLEEVEYAIGKIKELDKLVPDSGVMGDFSDELIFDRWRAFGALRTASKKAEGRYLLYYARFSKLPKNPHDVVLAI